jgi:hypothetical protein
VLEFDALAHSTGIRSGKFAGLEMASRDEILQQIVGCLLGVPAGVILAMDEASMPNQSTLCTAIALLGYNFFL